MPRGLKVSYLLTANLISFVNMSNFLKWKLIYTMTFRVAHWDTFKWWFCVLVCKGKTFLSVRMASTMYLHFSMHEEDILEHINGKCHLCTILSTCRPLCKYRHTPHNIIKHTHPIFLINALEHQVSWSDTSGEVVDH